MPLRDHFRPPVDNYSSWEELHGQWPGNIVRSLHGVLPPGYVAGPRVHLGSRVEIDIAAFESDDHLFSQGKRVTEGGTATAVWAPPAPGLAVETELPDFDEYEVRIYDARRGRQLVAAIEIVSPANADRPDSREAFVGKCAALIRKGIAVSIVDLVTIRHFNLYADLLALLGQCDPTLGDPAPNTYAAAVRWVERAGRMILETWSRELKLGQALPTLPLWLSADLSVPLDLEPSYEQACHDLWIA